MTNKNNPKQGIKQLKNDTPAVIARPEDLDAAANDADLALVQRTYVLSGKKANQIKETEIFAASAEKSLQTLNENISLNLKELQSHPNTQTAKSLEEGVMQLSALTFELIQSFKSRQNFAPKLSIIRPDIKYVYADYAYRYADLQSDANNLISFATLFLGTGIAALVSLIVSWATDQDVASLALYTTVTSISFIVTILFVILASNANKKAKQARQTLESSDNIIEIEIPDNQN